MAQLRAMVDKLLTDSSIGLFQALTSFGSERLLTPVSVGAASGIIGKYGNNHLRVHANAMGGRGAAPRVQLLSPVLTTTYLIENHGLEGLVTQDDYDNFEKPFDAEKDETEALTYACLVAKERALAAQLEDTAVLTANTTLSGTSQFSDLVNSDPMAVIQTGRQAIRDACGFYPDTAFMEAKVAEYLRRHPGIADHLGFKFNKTGLISKADLASVLDVQRVEVLEGVYNSASEGQTDVIAPIWGKHLWLGKLPTNPQLKQVSGGYYVTRTGRGPRQVWKYQVQNPPGSTAIIVKDDYDMLLSNVGAFYLIKNAVA